MKYRQKLRQILARVYNRQRQNQMITFYIWRAQSYVKSKLQTATGGRREQSLRRILQAMTRQTLIQSFQCWKKISTKETLAQHSHYQQSLRASFFRSLIIRQAFQRKQQVWNRWKTTLIKADKLKLKDQIRSVQETLQAQVMHSQTQLGQILSDKVEFIHDQMLELTMHKPLITRVEAVLALRFALNKFHLEHITDSELLRFMQLIQPHEQLRSLEEAISIKKDVFSEKNAKQLFRMVKKNKKTEQKGEEFKGYDVWEEGKISIEALSLFVLRQNQSQEKYQEFIRAYLETVEQQGLKSFHRLTEEEARNFALNLKTVINSPLVDQSALKHIYQNTLIKELEQQILDQSKNITRQQSPQKTHRQLSADKENQLLQQQLSPQPLSSLDQIQKSLTVEKSAKKQSVIKKKLKAKKKRLVTSNAQASLNANNFHKQKSPFLKQFSQISSQNPSNVSSCSDLFNQPKKKLKQYKLSAKKLTKQSEELSKLSKKVEDLESHLQTIKQPPVQQQAPPTIITIRESSLDSNRSKINLPLQLPQSQASNNQWQRSIERELDTLKKVALQSARPLIGSYLNPSFKLGSSLERPPVVGYSHGPRCTSKYCLICKS